MDNYSFEIVRMYSGEFIIRAGSEDEATKRMEEILFDDQDRVNEKMENLGTEIRDPVITKEEPDETVYSHYGDGSGVWVSESW